MSHDARGLIAAVHRVVDAHDPEGLLAMGCPPDEYSSEALVLAGLVADGRVSTGSVLAVWTHWFGPDNGLQRHPDRLHRLTESLAALCG